MANIKFGNGWADARGKVGGAVYSRNRSGAYVRTYVKPTNPRTPAQVTARNRFSFVSSSYRELTDQERAAWAYAASQVTVSNKVGDQIHLTASQYFAKQNMQIFSGGGTTIVTQPSQLVPIVGFVQLNAVATVTAGVVTGIALSGVLVDGTEVVPSNYDMQIYATPSLSQGISRPQPSQYSSIATVLASASTENIAILADYTDVFPLPLEGANVWLRANLFSIDTGQSSQPLEVKVTFVTAP